MTPKWKISIVSYQIQLIFRSRSASPAPEPWNEIPNIAEKANEELDALVSEFLAEEKKMLAWMDGEKRKSKINPEKHRSYASEWNYFYENKCKKEGVKVHPSMVRWVFKNV